MVRLGVVKEINLYPVKSMRAIPVREAQLYWYGLNGDRKYAWVRSETTSGFPWLTGRGVPDLLRYQPIFLGKENVLTSPVQVRTPDGRTLKLSDVQGELSDLHGAPVQLIRLNRGTYDAMPVSLITTSTLETLEHALGTPLERRRFRTNLVIESLAKGDFPEDAWLNRTLAFGSSHSARLRVTHLTKRCIMVNFHPDTAELANAPLAVVAKQHGACAGVYAAVEGLGTIRVGDTVTMPN